MADARAVWQISGGPSSRSYADLFIRHGVGLIGPGDSGPWRAELDDTEFEGSFVRRFASELNEGDIVLLRTSISKIRAIGLVASPYLHLNVFDDVNGWDLQHARRIRWSVLPTEYDFDALVFGANPPRVSRVRHEAVIDYALRYVHSPPTHWQHAPLPELPVEEPPLETVPDVLEGIVAEARDLYPQFWNRETFGDRPMEDELVAHVVVPFLRALGWPPEHIGVKWRYIDVALFGALPRTPETCRFVIEAKRLGAGVEGALQQAQRYVATLGAARDVVVTDGFRYRMYAGAAGFAPIAYANLIRLKQSAADLFARLRRS